MKREHKLDNPGTIEERIVRLETVISIHEKAISEMRRELNDIKNSLTDIKTSLSIQSKYFKILSFLGSLSLTSIISLLIMLLMGHLV